MSRPALLPIEDELVSLFSELRRDGLVLFPVRHHSPACSLHLRDLIRSRRPQAVLVEGPWPFTPLLPQLLDERTRAPVAFYTTFVDRRRRLPRADDGQAADTRTASDEPERFAAWYPFCDHSPELVALREGKAVGAELSFIDLSFPEKLLAASGRRDQDRVHHATSLMEETHLARSRFVADLARRLGCRDLDGVWDQLFEQAHSSLTTERFIDAVAAWCHLARREISTEALEMDGTLARERAMAIHVRDAMRRFPGDGTQGGIVVVTGGFHSVALPDLLRDEAEPRSKRLELGSDESISALTRYGFRQLDSLNGYGAGLPSPAYYQRLWERMERGDEPFTATASELLVEIGRRARESDLPVGFSTADAIAAVNQARGLAHLRGHRGPLREDLLDAVQSCYVKGSLDTEGRWVQTWWPGCWRARASASPRREAKRHRSSTTSAGSVLA